MAAGADPEQTLRGVTEDGFLVIFNEFHSALCENLMAFIGFYSPRKAPSGQTALDYARRSDVNGSHAEAI